MKGLGNNLLGAVEGTIDAIVHFPTTLGNVANMTTPAGSVMTGASIVQQVQQQKRAFKNGNAEARAAIIGAGVGEILQLFGGEVAEAGKLGKLSKIAEVAKGGRVAKGGTKLLNPAINITEKGLAHTLDRHTVNGITKWAKKSKFFNASEIESLIQQGTQMPMTRQANGNFSRVVDAGRNIGIDRATGNPTSIYTIITNGQGNLITAFPGIP